MFPWLSYRNSKKLAKYSQSVFAETLILFRNGDTPWYVLIALLSVNDKSAAKVC